MKISRTYPPNIEEIRKHFKINDRVVFTYGDTIYNPGGGKINQDLMEHERTHFVQQGNNVEGWWDKYIRDVSFRMSQELEAYKVQYNWFKENKCLKPNGKTRHERLRKFLGRIARDFSSEVYGFSISFEEAKILIKNS